MTASEYDISPDLMQPSAPAAGELDWMDYTRCRRHADLDLFFGPDGETPEARDAREALAIVICRPCPVRRPCLDRALAQPSQHGVAGGVGEERRKALRNAAMHRQRRAAGAP